jgi:hypothetical protein
MEIGVFVAIVTALPLVLSICAFPPSTYELIASVPVPSAKALLMLSRAPPWAAPYVMPPAKLLEPESVTKALVFSKSEEPIPVPVIEPAKTMLPTPEFAVRADPLRLTSFSTRMVLEDALVHVDAAASRRRICRAEPPIVTVPAPAPTLTAPPSVSVCVPLVSASIVVEPSLLKVSDAAAAEPLNWIVVLPMTLVWLKTTAVPEPGAVGAVPPECALVDQFEASDQRPVVVVSQ